MAFVPVPNVAEVFVEFTDAAGTKVGNVYHVEADVPPLDLGQLVTLVTCIVTWFTANRAAVSNGVSLTRVTARDITEQDSFVYDLAVSPAVPGLASNPLMPQNVTVSTSFKTGFAGRSFRGRKFWVGLYESAVSGDFVTTSVATSILAAFGALLTALDACGFTLVVASKYHEVDGVTVPRTVGIATPVTTLVLKDTRVDTQRRRLVGEGT